MEYERVAAQPQEARELHGGTEDAWQQIVELQKAPARNCSAIEELGIAYGRLTAQIETQQIGLWRRGHD
jgi:hypothetical protein